MLIVVVVMVVGRNYCSNSSSSCYSSSCCCSSSSETFRLCSRGLWNSFGTYAQGRNGSIRMYRSNEWLIPSSYLMISKLHRVSRQLARALLGARGEGETILQIFLFHFLFIQQLIYRFFLQKFCFVRIIIEKCVMNWIRVNLINFIALSARDFMFITHNV